LTEYSGYLVAYIALGANLGNPAIQVETACEELGRLPETRLAKRSALYLSKPVGYADQPDFVNAVVGVDTRLSPRDLMQALLEIEARHGRDRTFKNAPRTLDLDLLLYNGLVMHAPGLTLPHPRMAERPFVLLPLAEIAPDAIIPGHGRVADCLSGLPTHGIERLAAPNIQAAC
jgi:2-amino-4-hydroxy-6-hydroxymethyldihydropteridine diphosphokinase